MKTPDCHRAICIIIHKYRDPESVAVNRHSSTGPFAVLLFAAMLFILSDVQAESDPDSSAYTLDIVYTADYLSNVHGGIRRKTAYLDNLDLTLKIDTGKAFNITGGTLFAYGLYNNKTTFSDVDVGDSQTVSNIDTRGTLHLFEFWWEQRIGRHSLKFGLYDLNSEFDVVETAGLFINSSHGMGKDYSQSGKNGPSIFPVTSLALRYRYTDNNITLQTAVLDAVPGDPNHPLDPSLHIGADEGALLAMEANYTTADSRFGIGGWYYTRASADLLGTGSSHNAGIYAILERTLMVNPGGRRLDGWLRIGYARDSVNQFNRYIGAGLVWRGCFPTRPDDKFGIALAYAGNGDAYRHVVALGGGTSDSAETNIELTYRAPLTPWLTVQPDLQYIINPGTNPHLANALSIGVRFEIDFSTLGHAVMAHQE